MVLEVFRTISNPAILPSCHPAILPFCNFCYADPMAAYLDSVPLSGIIRILDMMYSVPNPYRLDQGDVSFDSPDSVKAAMMQAIADNQTHYMQTTGVPRLRELIAAKLRDKN